LGLGSFHIFGWRLRREYWHRASLVSFVVRFAGGCRRLTSHPSGRLRRRLTQALGTKSHAQAHPLGICRWPYPLRACSSACRSRPIPSASLQPLASCPGKTRCFKVMPLSATQAPQRTRSTRVHPSTSSPSLLASPSGSSSTACWRMRHSLGRVGVPNNSFKADGFAAA
jgi:hypothetical protein